MWIIIFSWTMKKMEKFLSLIFLILQSAWKPKFVWKRNAFKIAISCKEVLLGEFKK